MTARPYLKLSPWSADAPSEGDGENDIEALRQHLLDAENVISDLNRQITDATAAEQATGGIWTELVEITEARDFMKARLARLEGERHG